MTPCVEARARARIRAAALVLGTASLANAELDVNTYRPAVQDELGAYAQQPAQIRRGNAGTTVAPQAARA